MWQRRFFTLKGDMLAFYNTEEESSSGQPPKWSLDLGAFGAAASPFTEPGAPPDAARIELVAGEERFSLKAESEVEAEMWMAALATPPRREVHPAP